MRTDPGATWPRNLPADLTIAMSEEIRIEVAVSGGGLDGTKNTIIIPDAEALSLATVDFNPSGDDGIFLVKAVSAALMQLILDLGHGRAASLARTKIEEAKMWGVKSVVDKLQADQQSD